MRNHPVIGPATAVIIALWSLPNTGRPETYSAAPAYAGQVDNNQSISSTSYRIGTSGTGGSVQTAGWILYKMPFYAAGLRNISSATLGHRILIDSGTPTFNIDLYGVGYVVGTDPGAIYYSGELDTGIGLNIGNNRVVEIQDQFNSAGTQGNRVTSSTELLNFIRLTVEYINADPNVTEDTPAYLVFRLNANTDLGTLGTAERYRHIPDNEASFLTFDYSVSSGLNLLVIH
jgi:hypothetical protein